MKTAKEWKKEVDSTLKGKVNEALKAFQSQPQKDLEELVSLSEQLEKYENQKKELLATQEVAGKKFIPDLKTLNQCGLKINHVDKIIWETKGKIDAVFKELTSYPESIREIYPFLKLMG